MISYLATKPSAFGAAAIYITTEPNLHSTRQKSSVPAQSAVREGNAIESVEFLEPLFHFRTHLILLTFIGMLHEIHPPFP